MSETTYYQRNRDVILNRAKHYYKNDINTEIYRKKKKVIQKLLKAKSLNLIKNA